MPLKSGKLTPMERVFAQHLASTGDATYAATKAGFSSARDVGTRKKADPAIQAETRRLARDMLTEGSVVAVRTLIEIAEDQKQPAGARVNASDKILRHSGVSAADVTEKDPGEMDGVELRRAADYLREKLSAKLAELARRAKPVIDNEVELQPEPSIMD